MFDLISEPDRIHPPYALMTLDAWDVAEVRRRVRAGDYATLESCLQSFHPGDPTPSRTTAGDEWWSLGGETFAYGAGEVRPGYHLVEASDGLVHADSYVRVAYATGPYYGRKEIVRLETPAAKWPPAPDREP